MIVVSIFDILTPDLQFKWYESLKCFSIISNTKRLFKLESAPNSMQYLDGLRFLSMVWIILAHRSGIDFVAISTATFDVWKVSITPV